MAHIPYPATPDPVSDLLPVPLNVFRMMAHSGPLLRPAVELGMTNLKSGVLSPRLRELVILTVARVCRCSYVRVQHVPIALDAGVTSLELAEIVDHGTDPGEALSGGSGGAVRRGGAASGAHLVRPAVAALRKHLSHRQIVELGITVGYYTMLSGIMNGLDIDIDPSGDRLTDLANRR